MSKPANTIQNSSSTTANIPTPPKYVVISVETGRDSYGNTRYTYINTSAVSDRIYKLKHIAIVNTKRSVTDVLTGYYLNFSGLNDSGTVLSVCQDDRYGARHYHVYCSDAYHTEFSAVIKSITDVRVYNAYGSMIDDYKVNIAFELVEQAN